MSDNDREPVAVGPEAVDGLDYVRDLNDPGEYPYTRGRLRSRHGSTHSWIYRGFSGEGSPRRANEQLKQLIESGATGLDVIGDAPTVALVDPDHPLAEHTVGTQGVSLCRRLDYAEMYDGIPIGDVSLSHSLPANYAIAGLQFVAEDRGVDLTVLRGSTIIGPLYGEDYGYFTAVPAAERMRCALDAIEYATTTMPRFHPYIEDTYFFSDGGIGIVDEMALGFVELRTIIRRLLKRGLSADSFAPRIAVLVNTRMDLLSEVAKIRAARRMFARMMRTEFGARDPRSWSVNITAHTSGASLVGHEPINNVIRGAVQAMALALAGVQSMEVSAFDEPFRIPSPAAHVVGIRTQQVVAEETDLMRFIDPLGGSYTMERLTNDLEAAIWDRVRDIETLGDPVELAEDGYFRSILVNGMTDFAADIDEGRRVMIGANTRVEKTAATDLLREVSEVKVEPSSEHVIEVRAWKRQRNYRAVSTALADVERAIRHKDVNLMPAIIAAMRADATMGEIADLLRPNGAAFGPNPRPTDG